MVEENRNYYRARAEQEFTAASRAINSNAEAIHRVLANRYQDLATGISPEAVLFKPCNLQDSVEP